MKRAAVRRSRSGARRRAPALRWVLAAVAVTGALRAARTSAAPSEPTLPPPRASARALLEEGRRRYGAGDFAGALAFFEEAGRRAPARLDPARARFNAGAALEKMGRTENAIERFTEALQTTDLETQAAAWYNKGTAELSRAERLASGGNPTEARGPVAAALDSFRNALRLAPDDLDAKINFEWALRRQREIEEAAQRQQAEQQRNPQPREQPGEKPSPENGDSPPENQSPPDSGESPPPPEKPQNGESEESQPSGGSDASPPPASEGRPSGEEEREMSAEDALRLLDALRDEEDAQRRQMRFRLGPPAPVDKDW